MTQDETPSDIDIFRAELESWWADTYARATRYKDPHAAQTELVDLYEKFSPEVQPLADRVLSEWVTSDDVAKRFNALVLIDQFRIRSAVDQLRVLESTLAVQEGPEARFELKKVKRIIAELGE